MIAVIFEFTAVGAKREEYLELAAALNAQVKEFDGFLSIERFQSLSNPDRYVSLSFWRDEEAVRKWRNLQKHREAQARGRGGIFSSYRLRVCQVLRDYTRDSRTEAPKDSIAVHG
jgi:heme-degrading monooxygenase HmoA